MSKSKAKRVSTKAGVALTADALRKLKAVATWLEGKCPPTNPPVFYRLGFALATYAGRTEVNLAGALVQMFQPFAKADAEHIGNDLWIVRRRRVNERARQILDITEDEMRTLLVYIYRHNVDAATVAKQLRNLK